MTTDPIRALLLEMADELDHNRQCLLDDRRLTHPLADRARAALAAAPPEPVGEGEGLTDGPAVPEGREPASVVGEPSEEELLEEGPSLEEVEELCEEHCFNVEGYESIECLQGLINDALARWGRPAASPAPLQGEVGELVSRLRRVQSFDCARAAALIEQLAAAAPAVVPVPVSERLPGEEDCDAEGRCWLLTVEDEYPQWRLHSVEGHQPGGRMIWVPVDRTPGVMVDAFYASHWLPAHAIPLPAPQGGEVEA